MATLNPYLTFNGNCREAMNFYKEAFGGELTFLVVGDSPVADQMPPQYKDSILHSELKTDTFSIMASDMTPSPLQDGNGVHICLIFNEEAETRTCFAKLAAGGTVTQPIHEMFFGLIGTLTDKFNKNWMVECDKRAS